MFYWLIELHSLATVYRLSIQHGWLACSLSRGPFVLGTPTAQGHLAHYIYHVVPASPHITYTQSTLYYTP